MILLYIIAKIYSKIFSLNLKESSDGKVVLLTKKEYRSAVHFFINLNKTFKSNM